MTGAQWFHTSGITPALSDSAAAVTREALQAAKEAGVESLFLMPYNDLTVGRSGLFEYQVMTEGGWMVSDRARCAA